jgi:hypothetical protein
MASLGVPNLRRACISCTKAKRKCLIGLPECARCRQRDLECVYENEPLVSDSRDAPYLVKRSTPRRATLCKNNGIYDPEILRYISAQHMSNKIQAFCLKEELSAHNRSLMSTAVEIPVTTDMKNTLYVIGELYCIEGLAHRKMPTPFIHPELRLWGSKAPLYSGMVDRYLKSCGPNRMEFISSLALLEVNNCPLMDLVAAAQVLILFLIEHAFVQEQDSSFVPRLLDLLAKWRGLLWSSARARMPLDLSRWHSWILGETVRRTILMSYLLEGLFSAWIKGWCCHSLFISALPLSRKGHLWLANTETDWLRLAGTAASECELMFFHDFSDTFAQVPWDFGEDVFQRLLLATHHGREAVEEKLKSVARSQTAVSEGPSEPRKCW